MQNELTGHRSLATVDQNGRGWQPHWNTNNKWQHLSHNITNSSVAQHDCNSNYPSLRELATLLQARRPCLTITHFKSSSRVSLFTLQLGGVGVGGEA